MGVKKYMALLMGCMALWTRNVPVRAIILHNTWYVMTVSEAHTNRVKEYMALSTEYMAFFACDHIRGGQIESEWTYLRRARSAEKGTKTFIISDVKYRVASVSKIDQIVGLFCIRALKKETIFCIRDL